MRENTPLLRPVWSKLAPSPLALVIVLFVLFALLRGYGYFGGDAFNGLPVMASFLLMWLAPAIFLTAAGVRRIGLVRPRGFMWIPVALFAGTACAYVTYLIGYFLFGYSDQNWFMNIGSTYTADPRFAQLSQFTAFLIFTIPALLFSPIGEELFFRGMAQEAARERSSFRAGVLVNSLLFASIHLIHHGALRTNNGIEIVWLSAALWFALMFGTSVVFTHLRQKHGSVWVSVLAHAAFNLTMNYTIFYSLFVHQPTIPG